MTMRLVSRSQEAEVFRKAAFRAADDLFSLSLHASGLTGLLDLIGDTKDRMSEQEALAIRALAGLSQRIETEITEIARRLGEAVHDLEAPAS